MVVAGGEKSLRRKKARTKGRRRRRAETKEDGGGGELGRRSTEAARLGGGLVPVDGGRRTGVAPSAVSPSALYRESKRNKLECVGIKINVFPVTARNRREESHRVDGTVRKKYCQLMGQKKF